MSANSSVIHIFTLIFIVRTMIFPQSSSFPFLCDLNAAVITGHMVTCRSLRFSACPAVFKILASGHKWKCMHACSSKALERELLVSASIFLSSVWKGISRFSHEDVACLRCRQGSDGVGPWSSGELMGRAICQPQGLATEKVNFYFFISLYFWIFVIGIGLCFPVFFGSL